MFSSVRDALYGMRTVGVETRFADEDDLETAEVLQVSTFRRPLDLFQQYLVEDSTFVFRYDPTGTLLFNWQPPRPTKCPQEGFRLLRSIIGEIAPLVKEISSRGEAAVKRDMSLTDEQNDADLRYKCTRTINFSSEEKAAAEVRNALLKDPGARRLAQEEKLHDVIFLWNIRVNSDTKAARFIYYIRDKTLEPKKDPPQATQAAAVLLPATPPPAAKQQQDTPMDEPPSSFRTICGKRVEVPPPSATIVRASKIPGFSFNKKE